MTLTHYNEKLDNNRKFLLKLFDFIDIDQNEVTLDDLISILGKDNVELFYYNDEYCALYGDYLGSSKKSYDYALFKLIMKKYVKENN